MLHTRFMAESSLDLRLVFVNPAPVYRGSRPFSKANLDRSDWKSAWRMKSCPTSRTLPSREVSVRSCEKFQGAHHRYRAATVTERCPCLKTCSLSGFVEG